MRCVSWLLLGTCLLVLGPAVQGAPGQCPSLCHCHGDLQHVICDSAGLKKIPQVSDATRLLNLQRNSLGHIPTGAFSDSKGLISLHMQHCQLREIGSQAFKGLKKLVYLYLSNNEIHSIKPGAFEDLTELTYLYLDGNQISDLARGIFSPMINLFILQLNDNRLRELRPRDLHRGQGPALAAHERERADHPAAGLSGRRGEPGHPSPGPEQDVHSFGRYMEKLHLDNMSLEKFSDGAFTGVTAIKSLHLDNNKLKSLPRSLELSTITNLTLSTNPWSCSCQLAPLRRWMDSSRSRPRRSVRFPPRTARQAGPRQLRLQWLQSQGQESQEGNTSLNTQPGRYLTDPDSHPALHQTHQLT
ncbi:unnamed protein product [Pleuronectes platessa]|uniref:LRRNT domain-containing protein n=1 Tax=Pleuronectes platessa TaxID=8262 RepID=A0A9N7UL23_PLEPL|nr:unnamed protein product [Pleuronectes platessa]